MPALAVIAGTIGNLNGKYPVHAADRTRHTAGVLHVAFTYFSAACGECLGLWPLGPARQHPHAPATVDQGIGSGATLGARGACNKNGRLKACHVAAQFKKRIFVYVNDVPFI
jgi:hypothetical protein